LNDILIYNKTLKEHKTHMKEVLNKLHEVDLQINIDKCKFKIQKISFLELLIFINDLQMNFWKVNMIWSWEVSWLLIHMQNLHWLLQFLSTIHKELLKNHSTYDKTDLKISFFEMNWNLSEDFWWLKVINDNSLHSEAFQLY